MRSLFLKLLFSIICCTLGLGAVGAVFLTRRLPSVDAPRIRIDDRYSVDISLLETAAWERELLARFGEEPLDSAAFDSDECYRFILLPTFDRPLLVRVWRHNGRPYIVTKQLGGVGGYGKPALGKVAVEKVRPISEKEWQKVAFSIERSEFWYLPSHDPGDVPVIDGAFWYLEGSREGAIHTVGRITPSGQLGATFDFLLKLSGTISEYKGYRDWE